MPSVFDVLARTLGPLFGVETLGELLCRYVTGMFERAPLVGKGRGYTRVPGHYPLREFSLAALVKTLFDGLTDERRT